MEPQCRQPGPGGLPGESLLRHDQPSLDLQGSALLPPQCAAWPPPYLLGCAVGESNLSPTGLQPSASLGIVTYVSCWG